jgi:Methyltransferase domain
MRECNTRYLAIRDYLRAHNPANPISFKRYDFTVLDVGAYNGYFCHRLHDDFHAQCTAVDNQAALAPAPGVKVIKKLITPDGIRELGHFNVVLCLSVLHHWPNWHDYLKALLSAGDLVFIESANPAERGLGRYRDYAVGAQAQLSQIGTPIAHSLPIVGEQLRPLWAITPDGGSR